MNETISYLEFLEKKLWIRWHVVAYEPFGYWYTSVSHARELRRQLDSGEMVGEDLYTGLDDRINDIIDAMIWLGTQIGGRYHICHRFISFESREDALLFKLTWGNG